MSYKNINQPSEEELAILKPSLAELLSNDNIHEPCIPIAELIQLSNITQTPLDEILKPIDFPYWSL